MKELTITDITYESASKIFIRMSLSYPFPVSTTLFHQPHFTARPCFNLAYETLCPKFSIVYNLLTISLFRDPGSHLTSLVKMLKIHHSNASM